MVTKWLQPVVETEASLVNVKSFDLSPQIQPQLFLHLHNKSVYHEPLAYISLLSSCTTHQYIIGFKDHYRSTFDICVVT